MFIVSNHAVLERSVQSWRPQNPESAAQAAALLLSRPPRPHFPPCDWISSHSCWHNNLDTGRGDWTQRLGLLSELAERTRCDTCQKIYRIITDKAWLFDGYAENDVICSIIHNYGSKLYFHIEVRICKGRGWSLG